MPFESCGPKSAMWEVRITKYRKWHSFEHIKKESEIHKWNGWSIDYREGTETLEQ